ncbi:unnamed protein product [Rotaria sp. Silwood1]|nr:unnamed protein product [Rotaria sp. Silwood1]CAF5069761.1 unnamed protein product [Rotaria sp. Silwood1]
MHFLLSRNISKVWAEVTDTKLKDNHERRVSLKQKVEKGYEEVHLCALKPSALDPEEVLYPISNLSKYAQPVFDDYKVLNHIQTHIVNVSLKSNENMFLCASTDTGKINVALLCILHEIAIISCTIRIIEMIQDTVRFVGLSATLPNYEILIFIHSRKESGKTTRVIRHICLEKDTFEAYLKEDSAQQEVLRTEIE